MRRSPQEKKRLSYLKDGRNVYGENDKASRKNLPKKKKLLPLRSFARIAGKCLQ
jgi:hypothetical protein